MLEKLIQDVENNTNIQVLTRATLASTSGSVENFTGELDVDGTRQNISYGAAVLTTGGKESTPDEYGHGDDERILTHFQMDTLIESPPETIKAADTAVFIQCVGSPWETAPVLQQGMLHPFGAKRNRTEGPEPANERLRALSRYAHVWHPRRPLYKSP